jgi:hypothetical protein
MKCNECVIQELTSKVWILEEEGYYGVQTDDGIIYLQQGKFWDEDGNWHVHDPNEYKTVYKCSNGHIWTKIDFPDCWCEWKHPSRGKYDNEI